ncbi:MAG TPA: hypothetical protein PLF48_08880, partial [Chitinophagales bacterium]|nr:hypothetical protein [Chitinophagales bacterium]
MEEPAYLKKIFYACMMLVMRFIRYRENLNSQKILSVGETPTDIDSSLQDILLEVNYFAVISIV